jgi:hypothetical protein
MTVQERLRQRFLAGFAKLAPADVYALHDAFRFLGGSSVVVHLGNGDPGTAFSNLEPRYQLQAVEYVEGRSLLKPTFRADDASSTNGAA